MDAFEAIRTRRSIRQMTGAPVPRADLEQIVEAARWAPSGHNQQPWEFVVVTDRAMIEALSVVAGWMKGAGAIIAVIMETSSNYWVEDAAAAIENMLLASTALGYGSCWVEGDALVREQSLKELLHVPAPLRLLALIPVGKAVEQPVREKKPLESILHWETYPEKD